jgi:hypothetical protein
MLEDSLDELIGLPGYTPSLIVNNDGKMHFDPAEVTELWAQHYEKLFDRSKSKHRNIPHNQATRILSDLNCAMNSLDLELSG